MLTPGDIRDKEFKSTVFGNLDAKEVTNFLDLVADEIERLRDEIDRLKKISQKQEDEIHEYYDKKDTLDNMLFNAQKIHDKIIEDANKKKEEVILEAQTKARKSYQKEFQEVEQLKKQQDRLRHENNQFMQRLRYIINEHLELLSKCEKESFNVPEGEDHSTEIKDHSKENINSRPHS